MNVAKFTCNGTNLPADLLTCRITKNHRNQALADLPEGAEESMVAMQAVAQAVNRELKHNTLVRLFKVGNNYAIFIKQPNTHLSETLPGPIAEWINQEAKGEAPESLQFTIALPHSIVENATTPLELAA